MKKLKLAIAISLLGAATLANAAYWSRTNYGTYSAYSGTRVGGWNLSGATKRHYVFYGREKFQCPTGLASCSHTFSESVNFNWSLATGYTATATLIPDVFSLSVTQTFTVGKSYTETYSSTANLVSGQLVQFVKYVPRRYGNATVYGVRVATGNTRRVCPTQGPLGTCWSGWKTEWEYNDVSTRVGAILNAWKNTDNPISTFVVNNNYIDKL